MEIVDENSVRRIHFNRPQSKNAMTTDVARELASAIEEVTTEYDAVVVTGQEDAFSAGGDIEAMATRSETADEAYTRVRSTLGQVAEAVLTAPVPVVARVNGDAAGAGLSLVAASDFAYAVESARFGASFINVGLVPDMGGTVTLPRIVGLREAKRLAFTGELISAAEAADLGLVNHVVAESELDEAVEGLLETLSSQPTEGIALAKQALHDNLGRTWSDGLEHEASIQTRAYDTAAHEEGVTAFLEGRRPDFD
ncbi:Enoyl-CoA hydratase/carnithine racemase [Halogranum amylolyticum]|uniref:Enoyl-CoA hydratase/carnithine racemase n=1 Tax=Halogranum amylolyticum TaxID=660520 RepID=A0A1H8WR71_9EURY|nr:enoyl-CoA hydratase-related protein [Halogranum amylolyticum]SEP30106.1 Enoyl-CoA hydratase/carnithine racemase [Halogranum amylolyticum]